jgi:hypothetical protein
VSKWTEEEVVAFYASIRTHGKDWLKTSDDCNHTVTGVKKKAQRLKMKYM